MKTKLLIAICIVVIFGISTFFILNHHTPESELQAEQPSTKEIAIKEIRKLIISDASPEKIRDQIQHEVDKNNLSQFSGLMIKNLKEEYQDGEVSLEVEPIRVKFGDDITIHASLPSYKKPDDLRYYIDVFDLEGRKVDSTLWFARTDFNYTMRTEHPAFNITRAGDYTIYVEKALNIERTGEIVKNTSFTITTNPPPLKQVNRGISPSNVICNDQLGLIIKSSDGYPACVKSETKSTLIERGWAKSSS